ncbi:MAG: sigma-54 factor interaction domain-containing protein [Candidatus Eisenbacteria bacterium]|uniref:Sigma-54 factor interaction domain-containing protein n=1 Tax=Eiseniibacteriota bacterium TaxID=2212470 RepID=A0A948RX14_UNCEI|nr:sigma-54 factor interaction domain-containing protein [Candidatus Eisenbacteria bacterium]MBU1950896.1 sigma-54 factor interaction domain-containing protein [Candidatus Eisenbacteria bacterium]MBU2692600.1 sigma-54 factor interaction domain-containing protein [Candidatus Eisenbacteria bacterium]
MGRLELLFAERAFKTVAWQPGGGPTETGSMKRLGEIRELLLESRGLLNSIKRADLVSQAHHMLEELWLRCPWREPDTAAGGAGISQVRLKASGYYRRHRRLGVGTFLTRDMKLLSRLEDLEPIAGSDLPILILGQSGTGKELIARAIHEASNRRGRAFVPVNCGAVPSELHESACGL